MKIIKRAPAVCSGAPAHKSHHIFTVKPLEGQPRGHFIMFYLPQGHPRRHIFSNISQLSQQDLEKLVHAFIFSRLDDCNGVVTGLPKKSIRQLQLMQNAATRVLTDTKRVDHFVPVLRSLYTGFLSLRE